MTTEKPEAVKVITRKPTDAEIQMMQIVSATQSQGIHLPMTDKYERTINVGEWIPTEVTG